MMKKKTNESYAAALKSLEDIINQMETGEVGVDELREKLKEATALIDTCNIMLRGTEEELEKLTRVLEENDSDLDR